MTGYITVSHIFLVKFTATKEPLFCIFEKSSVLADIPNIHNLLLARTETLLMLTFHLDSTDSLVLEL